MNRTIHNLKCWPEYFVDIVAGLKTAEVRKDDRHFSVGDTLVLHEWSPETAAYSGQSAVCEITHVLRDFVGLQHGWCMLSLRLLDCTNKDGKRMEVVGE